jgi:hypothetical protein
VAHDFLGGGAAVCFTYPLFVDEERLFSAGKANGGATKAQFITNSDYYE